MWMWRGARCRPSVYTCSLVPVKCRKKEFMVANDTCTDKVIQINFCWEEKRI